MANSQRRACKMDEKYARLRDLNTRRSYKLSVKMVAKPYGRGYEIKTESGNPMIYNPRGEAPIIHDAELFAEAYNAVSELLSDIDALKRQLEEAKALLRDGIEIGLDHSGIAMLDGAGYARRVSAFLAGDES